MEEAKETTAKPIVYVGIILGVLSLFILALLFGFLAIVIGIMALGRARREERSLCYLSIGLGAIGLIGWALAVIFWLRAPAPAAWRVVETWTGVIQASAP